MAPTRPHERCALWPRTPSPPAPWAWPKQQACTPTNHQTANAPSQTTRPDAQQMRAERGEHTVVGAPFRPPNQARTNTLTEMARRLSLFLFTSRPPVHASILTATEHQHQGFCRGSRAARSIVPVAELCPFKSCVPCCLRWSSQRLNRLIVPQAAAKGPSSRLSRARGKRTR